MKEMFQPDSPAMVFLRRMMKLVQLNLLWALCCVPVVTAGAATVSMYGTVAALRRDMEAKEENVDVVPCFFGLFRREFRQSTLLMLVKVGVLALLAADFRIAYIASDAFSGILGWMCLIPAVLLLLVNGYVYPMQAKFSNGVGQTLKNAALIAFSNPAVSISVALLNALPLLLLLKSLQAFVWSGFLWLVIGVSVIAWLNWMMLNRVFEKYIPETREEESK